MTLLNIIRKKDVVHVITDGAVIETGGNVRGFAPKVAILPNISAVIVFRGDYDLGRLITHNLSGARSYEELKSSVKCTTDGIIGHVSSEGRVLECDVAIAGFTKEGDSASCIYSTIDRPTVPTREVIEPGALLMTPLEAGSFDAYYATVFHKQYDVERDSVTLAQEQRKIVEPTVAGGPLTSKVGGFLQLTTITRSDITTKIIHRWNDVIGELIRV